MHRSTVLYSMYLLTAMLLPAISTGKTEGVITTTCSVMTPTPDANNNSLSSTLVNVPPPERTLHNRVMYGDKTSICQFPYLVSVQLPQGHHTCGGSLVRTDWVLTATHCLVYKLTSMHDPSRMSVFAGNTNVLRPERDHPDSRRVTATFIHDNPKNTRRRRHDIGLILLSSPYVLRDSIQLVTLPPLLPQQESRHEHYDDNDPASTQCLLAGWGHHVTEPDHMRGKSAHFRASIRDLGHRVTKPDHMRGKSAHFRARKRDFGSLGEHLYFAELERINTSTCQRLWMAAVNHTVVIHRKHVCTSGKGGKDSCKGDSGGPLMCGHVQVGLVSFVHTCGRNVTPPNPVVYVRLAHYVQWIDATIRANDVPVMTEDDLEREARDMLKADEASSKGHSGAGRDEALVFLIAIGFYVI